MTARERQQRYYNRRIRPKLAAGREAKQKAWAMPVASLDACWAAGHFEGEGTVTIQSAGTTRLLAFKPLVSLSSTDQEVVEFFRARWPTAALAPRVPTSRAKHVWTWRLNGAIRVHRFLGDLRPHIRTSRVLAKVDVVARFCERLLSEEYNREGDKLWKLAMVCEIRRMNHRGTGPMPHMLTSDGRPLIDRVIEAKLLPPPKT